MKVLYIIDYHPLYHNIWSGAEVILNNLLSEIDKKNIDYRVISTRFDKIPEKPVQNLYEINSPFQSIAAISRTIFVDFISYIKLKSFIKKYKPDIIHLNSKYFYIYVIELAHKLKIPIVYTVPDYYLFCPITFIRKPDGTICEEYHNKDCYKCTYVSQSKMFLFIDKITPRFVKSAISIYRKKYFDRINQYIDTYITLTDISRKRLLDYGIREKNVKTVYHYNIKELKNASDFKPVNNTKYKNKLLFVGWISPHKGFHILIESLNVLAKKHTNDFILYAVGVGDVNFINEIKEKIKEYNIQDNVMFLGKQDNKDVLNLISAVDVVIVPEQWPNEFGPVILIEASSFGIPVVASNIGATNEFIKDTVNGFLVLKDKPEEFASAINKIISDEEHKKQMKEMAFECGEKFRNNDYINDIISLYGADIGKYANRH